ncbi:bifunctional diguanylate cyclase/phosphodiesterase [Undibacterium sp. Ji49W]|uniref:bifunctional diguanylate cyclase/phosphodiesterase n=1 Tax=Undibacterium sp. Ji49W TaxID=3413040 RepID=UPI003BF02D81
MHAYLRQFFTRPLLFALAIFLLSLFVSFSLIPELRDWNIDDTSSVKLAHASNTARHDLLFNYLIGFVFSAMLAYLVRLLLEARQQKHGLKKIIEKRTAQLAQREAELRRAQAMSKTGSWISSLDNQDIRYTEEACRIWGISPGSKITCTTLIQRIHPDDKTLVINTWAKAMTGQDMEIEHRILVDTQTRWLHIQIKLERQADGSAINRYGTVQDITERKRVEEDLRIAAIAFEGQEGMVITDERRTILRVNQAFTRITGYTREEAIGKQTSLLKSGMHGNSFYAEMTAYLEKSGYWQGEIWNRRKSGEVYPEWLTITAVKSGNGNVVNYVATMLDITQRKTTEAKLEHLAYHDALTGLANRRLLLDRLQHTLLSKSRHNRFGALLFLDLDNFKSINDTIGHGKGDLLLQVVAKRLAHSIRQGDTLARHGGDEFVLLLDDLSDNLREAAIEAQMIAAKILSDLHQPYDLEHFEYHSSASIGITLFGRQNDNAEELLKQVEVAMYEAKASGGNLFRFFDLDMLDIVNARAAMEADLRLGLTQQQFVLHYQPQVNAAGTIIGAEALVRWQHPLRGLVSPAEFIPLAEESGLIIPLGIWILQTACQKLAEWQRDPATSALTLAVNVSARQFKQIDFVAQVQDIIRHASIDASKLKLELTESLLVDNAEETIARMNQLKMQGVGFSLDDFGTGYSSLSYLRRLPLDQLKIDQSFVREMLNNTNDAVITRTIIGLGQSLGLAVIAEGVETSAQQKFLVQQGCQAFQGYLYGKPSPDLIYTKG